MMFSKQHDANRKQKFVFIRDLKNVQKMSSLPKQDITTICGCVIFVVSFKKTNIYICTCANGK